MHAYPLQRDDRGQGVLALQLVLRRLVQASAPPFTSARSNNKRLLALNEEMRKAHYGPATAVLVEALRGELGLREHAGVDEAVAQALDKLLQRHDRSGGLTMSDAPQLVATGVVRYADGSPATGASVALLDVDLRRTQRLGEDRTDSAGRYWIPYSAERFAKSEKGSADLRIEVPADGKPLAVSDTHFNVEDHVEIDVQIPAAGQRPPSLFARVEAAIEPVLDGVAPHELEENGAARDITFLAGETSYPPDVLARYAVAHRLARAALEPQPWFALLHHVPDVNGDRALQPQAEAFLTKARTFGPETVRKALKRAVAEGVIDETERDEAQHAKWIEAYLSFAAQALLHEGEKPSLLGGALGDAGVRGEAQLAVAREVSTNGRLTREALDKLRAAKVLSDKQADDVRASLDLAELTGGDLALVRGLRKDFKIERSQDLAKLARVDAAVLERSLEARLQQGPAPILDAPITDELDSPVRGAYSASVRQRLVKAFPTAAFSGDLERAANSGSVRGLRQPKEVVRVLAEHPELDLLHTRVDEALANQRVSAEVRTELKTIQRVFKLAPSFAATQTLLADELHSAQSIYRLGESEFVRRYAREQGFDESSARITWNRAADTHAAVLTIVADLQALRPEGLPAVLVGNMAALNHFPNWESLFKSGDLCECEHCRSVLSPAAYFADLMMFLRDRRAINPAHSVKDLLLARREDLGFIELNCHNALRTLPYIDIVCEVLERAVAGDANDLELAGLTAIGGVGAAEVDAVRNALATHGVSLGEHVSLSQVSAGDPDRWVVHGSERTYLLLKKATPNFFARVLPNSHASAQEMRAYPQYVDPHAYTTLRSARHPLVLPFDLFGDEVRAALRKAKVDRWRLMEAYRSANAPNNPSLEQIAAEYFAIAVDAAAPIDEFRLITQAAPGNAAQREIWGESGAGWLATVANVKVFLNKTRLTYIELLQLLDLPFINPNGALAIHHEDASCDLDKKSIENLNAAALDRVHRFLRLWRKLAGWTPRALDLVLRHPAIGAGNLNAAFLRALFYFDRVMKRLGKRASVEHVALLFGDINTRPYLDEPFEPRGNALYQSSYLNKRLIEKLDPAFVLDEATQDIGAGHVIADHRPTILAALNISEPDLILLEQALKPSDDLPYLDGSLTLASLSFLQRHAWLAKSLQYRIADWLVLLRLHDQDIERFASPEAAWRWIERLDRLRAIGLSVAELDWLAGANRASTAAAKEADAARFLTSLRGGLQTIRAEYDPAQYPFLTAVPPTDVEALGGLLDDVLGELGRSDQEALEYQQALAGTLRVSVPVAGLPGGFQFPDPIASAIAIRHDETAGVITFTGWMSAADRTLLLTDASLAAVTGIAAYQEAIDALFERARLVLKFFEPLFTTPLAVLPAAVDFAALDPALRARVGYDVQRQELSFRGLMSEEEHAALDALSADAAYRNAVNTLAVQPGLIAAPDERIWLEDGDLSQPLADPANLAVNRALAITRALPYLARRASVDLVVQQAAAALRLPEAQTQWLLNESFVAPGPLLDHLISTFALGAAVVDYASDPTTFDAWFWAQRVAVLWTKLRVNLTEAKQLQSFAAAGDVLDIADLPLNDAATPASWDELAALHTLVRLRNSAPEWDLKLFDALELLLAGEYATEAEFAEALTRVHDGWAAADAERLLTALDPPFPAGYAQSTAVERLIDGLALAAKLNASVDSALEFATPTMTPAHTQSVQGLLRGKYGVENWLQLSAEVQDELREKKRTALAAYLLAQPQPADAPSGKWENTNDLYAYYLLDVEMCSCQLTSRLVQATGSVQLFVQRCFMGLEPQVQVIAHGDDGDSAWRWWTWMRKYRVWEANRKVFLWPENWIEPELKKDRSSFFKELENELLQNDVSADSVEDAFITYLEKLDGVAQLEIAGFYQEDDADETILHVFGRNRGVEPHSYFYRTYDYRQWTPWEKVDLEIQGEYLIPVVVNRRLFLFWPVFTELPDEDENNAAVPIPDSGDSTAPVKPAKKLLRMQMAMSSLRSGKWTPKVLSKHYDESSSYSGQIAKQHYEFYPVDRSAIDDRFGVKYDGHSVLDSGNQGAYLSGTFELTGCSGLPELGHLPGSFTHLLRPEADAVGALTYYARWREQSNRPDAADNDLTLTTNAVAVRVLDETPWRFFITPPWHLSYLDRLLLDGLDALAQFTDRRIAPIGAWLPYFYHDLKRTFFVLPCLSAARGERETGVGLERAYYPQIKEFFRNIADVFEGAVRTWVNAVDLGALAPAVRAQIEQFLHTQLGGEVTPPYTDEQLRELMVRYFMRFVNLFLGLASVQLFGQRQFHYKNYYHPFVCDFAKIVRNPLLGVPEMMRRETQLLRSPFSFKQSYKPTGAVVQLGTLEHYPVEEVDFSPDGAYASYNWELFFHAPLHIANSLSRNQRFEEAREWYHFIFNPLGVESAAPGGSPMSKFWITKPFYETTDAQYIQQRIDNILHLLAGDTATPGYSPQAQAALEEQVRDWRVYPFEPHRIANYRTVAYQKTVVMKYLDNLIAWGDYLFRQDSMESINEATQLYILGAEILGPAPKKVPPQARPAVQSFNELEQELDAFANALIETENLIPALPGGGGAASAPPLPMLYFCIPHNEKLLGYWTTIEDRLRKIRSCMNIDGVVRSLALFEPPIDPAALVKAIAGGLDIGAAIADLNAPLPLYRFSVLLQLANQMTADVRALGGALLAALEKKDAEALATLRQGHEKRALEATLEVRRQQIDEAKEALNGLKRSKELVNIKRSFYAGRDFMNAGEIVALALHSVSAALDIPVSVGYIAAGVLKAIPNFLIGASGFGGSPHATAETGGEAFGETAKLAIQGLAHIAQNLDKIANISATVATYQRRQDEWDFQVDCAEKELEQVDASIAGAEVRVALAERELANQAKLIEDSKAVAEFMKEKYTNEELYQWQITQISGVYFQSYKLAYDLAKRAERCFRFELGLAASDYIKFGYWDSLRKGLLAGEHLQYDLRRLESAYIEENRREFELTKHVSLAMLDPLALVKLRETGRCFFDLPEELFDHDFPGHYFRRIKSLSITVPSVIGPYTTLACTLRLLKNGVRVNTLDGDAGYARNVDEDGAPADDERFVENHTPRKAIAISSANSDSGLFELNFKDDRYLPFEGAGVISSWALELFNDQESEDFGKALRQFDYSAISDVVVHLKYTAREDAGPFKAGAIAHLREYFEAGGAGRSLRILDLRNDFGSAWRRFINPAVPADGNVFELEASPALFYQRDAGKRLKINAVSVIARGSDDGDYQATFEPPFPGGALALAKRDDVGGLHVGELDASAADVTIAPAGPPATWRLRVQRPGGGDLALDAAGDAEVSDLFLILAYEWE